MLKLEEIKEIIKMVDESSLKSFKLEQDGAKIIISKEEKLYRKKINTDLKEENEESIASKTDEANLKGADNENYEIKSPMVGNFYLSGKPQEEPFVKVGQKVNENTVVCVIETMKIYNEIEAGVQGKIVEVLASDGEFVEYGQPLFKVKKN